MTRRDEFDHAMDNLSKNKDLERGLVQLSTMNNNRTDPEVRAMATAVLSELQKAKERRAINNLCGCLGLIIALVIVGFMFAYGVWPKRKRF